LDGIKVGNLEGWTNFDGSLLGTLVGRTVGLIEGRRREGFKVDFLIVDLKEGIMVG